MSTRNEDSSNKRWTWHNVKSILHGQFPELDNISESTILIFINNLLEYFYKKLERKSAPSLRSDTTRKIYEGVMFHK